MKFHTSRLLAALTIAGVGLVFVAPAQALSMKECSAKYKAAQAGGTLNGMKWNEFRKAQCGAEATPATPASGSGAPAAGTESAKAVPATEAAKPTTPAAVEGSSAGTAVFPSAISDKYTSEKPGKARMKTCLDQYNANKAANANGGLKWIQKGGGYFSECTKRLKGS